MMPPNASVAGVEIPKWPISVGPYQNKVLRLYFAKDRRCLGYPGFSGRQNGILRTGSTVRYPGTGSRVPTGTHIYTKFICTRSR